MTIIPVILFLIVVLPLQVGPSRKPAVYASDSFTMAAQSCRGTDKYISGLVAIYAARPFAVAAPHLYIFFLILCHYIPILLYIEPEARMYL
jgi:hypothetical protein